MNVNPSAHRRSTLAALANSSGHAEQIARAQVLALIEISDAIWSVVGGLEELEAQIRHATQ